MTSLRRFIIKRLAQMVPLIFFWITFVFFLARLAPGDPVTYLYGPYPVPEEQMAHLRTALGLDRPLLDQYSLYLNNLLHGNLGTSQINLGRPVSEIIFETIPNTLLLMGTAFVASSIFGILLGVIAAKKSRSKTDYVISTAAMVGYSMPIFWFGLLLMLAFSVYLGYFPAVGMTSGRQEIPYILDVLHHLFLPSIVLGLWYSAVYFRFMKGAMLEALGQDYIVTAWAKGLNENQVYFKHAMKNALMPVMTMMGLQIGAMLSGAVLTETVFAWPGMGRLLFTSITQRDYPLIMGIFMVVAVFSVTVNLITDLIYTWVDPRIRYK